MNQKIKYNKANRFEDEKIRNARKENFFNLKVKLKILVSQKHSLKNKKKVGECRGCQKKKDTNQKTTF